MGEFNVSLERESKGYGFFFVEDEIFKGKMVNAQKFLTVLEVH